MSWGMEPVSARSTSQSDSSNAIYIRCIEGNTRARVITSQLLSYIVSGRFETIE